MEQLFKVLGASKRAAELWLVAICYSKVLKYSNTFGSCRYCDEPDGIFWLRKENVMF